MGFEREGIFVGGVVLLFLLIVIFIVSGEIARRRTTTAEGYYLAGRSVGPVTNAFAIVSAYLSCATFLGFTAFIWGLQSQLIIMSQAWMCGFLVMIISFSGPLRRLGTYTAAGYISERFRSEYGRLIAVGFMIFIMIMYAVSQMKAIAHVFEMLLGVSYVPGLFIGGIVVVLYVTIGGMYGVTWNQALQGAICVIAMFVPVMAILQALGANVWYVPFWGYGNMVPEMLEAFPKFFDVLYPPEAHIKWYQGVFFSMLFGTASVPHYLSRVASAKTIKEGRYGFLLGLFFIGFVNVLTFGSGFAGVLWTSVEGIEVAAVRADMLLLILSDIFVGDWALAMVMAGAFAAGLSTTAGALIVIGTGIAHDIVGSYKELTERQKLIFAPIVSFVGGIVIIFVTINPPAFALASVIWAIAVSASVFTAPLIMGIWWKGANKYGVIWSMLIGGFLCMYANAQFAHPSFTWSPIWSDVPYGSIPYPGVLSVPASFVVLIFVSLITNRIPSLAAKIPREETDLLIEKAHGWPEKHIPKNSKRYNSETGPIIIGLIMLFFVLYALFGG